MKFYRARRDPSAPHSGNLSGIYKWYLPPVLDCPGCGPGVFGTDTFRYPCVDLTGLPNLREFEDPSPRPLEVYLRLREQVLPQLPPGAVLGPGTALGPMVGRASGSFGPLFMHDPGHLEIRREALAQLQEAGVRGLRGCPTELRFRGKSPPELLEPQLEIRGELHRDCLPADAKTCERCGSKNYSLPDPPILDAATLPGEVDLFRLAGWSSLIIATERFVDAVKRLGLDGVVFREVQMR
ncbi:SitI6 family double-CXXCG motif immunity protein [Pyxidicoccus xibeiensis]|uniref:SitI6 family double-CXXCG motif immunity protein n=1 Tax=Pyxidicoccus xibeiensis TaxID=2906759 RepID=UPI0020A785C7|nr:double-CXXCG motif protein [Pyxidicoccus xibeiensis]MCP3137238.1 double-CXXCG motif protein [Pyxidicoccus xibeiensis]